LGLISTALLYGAVRRLWGGFAAAVAAGLFSFHLPSVHFLRWGMPYDLCMAFDVAAFWALARGQRGRRREAWDATAVVLAGLGAATAFFGVATLAVASAVAALRMRQRKVRLCVALALGWAPILAFFALATAIRGQAFWIDFASLFARGSGGQIGAAVSALALQMLGLLARDGVYVLGVIGLIWTAWRSKGRRWVAAYGMAALIPVLVKRGMDPQIKYDEVMFLFVLYAAGGAAAAALRNKLRHLSLHGPRPNPALARHLEILFWCGALGTLAMLAAARTRQVCTRIPSNYEKVGSVLSPADANKMAQWVNERVKGDDLVIAGDRVYWMLRGRVANLYQSVAYVSGSTTWHERIEPWRWRFPCDYRQARFIILDHTDRAIVLSPANPHMDLLAAELDSPRFRMVMDIGEYWVFERTNLARQPGAE
ncbi:MAG: hypothetical protein NTW86_24710, partial [Candidatus Sumerlaeota bacterium]|nr:hypothetical protein [Candidatus Sumerlaeota bacterium]